MRIIIVEDERSIRKGLSNMLPKLDPDNQVAGTASNGREGLELIERLRPDLVIMDIQMPEMDGLTMLEHLRRQGNPCRVIVLTAYSDFSYAKQAIGLNIDNYLLKPIKLPELKETLRIIRESFRQEEGKERLEETLLSLQQIFRGSILAELPVDDELQKVLADRYALDVEEPLALYSVWLGKAYEACHEKVVRQLEMYMSGAAEYDCCIIPSIRYQLICVVFFHMKNPEKIRSWFGETVTAAIVRALAEEAVYVWTEASGFRGLPGAFASVLDNLVWNLCYQEGTMLCTSEIAARETTPFKYPMGLEAQLRQTQKEHSLEEYQKLLEQFKNSCIASSCHPEEIREACIRFSLTVLDQARSLHSGIDSIPAQSFVGELSQAVTWGELHRILLALYEELDAEEEGEDEFSVLVKKARNMIEAYYDQGITLEELAEKLCVSDEYLSSVIKKETGMSFTETVRGYRINRIKELLINSSLKLNQIADMAGYSDPKYMSKVFKEEVGMLPAEFRKLHH